MAHKYLRELLNEDQEPFVLNNFIHDRRRQLKRSVPRTPLRAKARKTISQNSRLPGSFCNNACFFPSHDLPDVMKSPIFDFSAPKSPCRNSDTLFVDIPASTAAFLLEAASRIQKSKSESPNKSLSSGLLGSILKRISPRKRNQKRETEGVRVSMKDILRRDSSERLTEQTRKSPDTVVGLEEKRLSEMGFPCSSTSRLSSVLSESNEEKTVDLETSTSRSEDCVEMEFLSKQRKNGDFTPSEKGFCSSPFRFSLNKNPSPGRRSPDYQSPASSPSRDKKDFTPCQKEFCLSPSRFSPDHRSPAFQSPTMSPSRHNEEGRKNEKGNSKDYEEEEKEQFSPVSVLDPPFDDDDIEHEVEEQEDVEDDLELDPSFAIVQRAKQHLLEKLLRFERLAELDPIELEKRMMEDEEDEDDEHESDDQLSSLHDEKSDDGFVKEVLSVTNSFNSPKIQPDFKRLVLDFVAEEGRDEFTSEDKGNTAKKVCRRLELLKEVESNDISMMLELDLRRESNDWRKHQEQVQELTVQMELAIFGFLVEELSWELVCCHGQ